MKNIFLFTLSVLVIFGAAVHGVSAQMMGGNGSFGIKDDHTKQEEAEGKEVWEKFQAKEKSCADLKDDDFEALGEYFMGTMMGDAHAAMNAMITQGHGEEGEEQMHAVMGKRLSGCDPSAEFPAGSFGFMPMMNMMGGWSTPFGSSYNNRNMMSVGYGLFSLGVLGMLLWALWWVVVVVLIVWIVRRLFGSTHRGGSSALQILKERYAKGEIDKQEFEEKKKTLER